MVHVTQEVNAQRKAERLMGAVLLGKLGNTFDQIILN